MNKRSSVFYKKEIKGNRRYSYIRMSSKFSSQELQFNTGNSNAYVSELYSQQVWRDIYFSISFADLFLNVLLSRTLCAHEITLLHFLNTNAFFSVLPKAQQDMVAHYQYL